MKSDGSNYKSRIFSPFDFGSLRLKMTLFLPFLSLNLTITFSLFFIRWQTWKSSGVTIVPVKEISEAALSIEVFLLLKKELTISTPIREFYWTDSKVVLGYISNEAKRFNVFVESKGQLIRQNSDVNQWRYIETKKNPADYTSHDLTPSYSKKVKSWISCPEFLWQEESKWSNLEDQVPGIANGRSRSKNNCQYKCCQDWRWHLIQYGGANI